MSRTSPARAAAPARPAARPESLQLTQREASLQRATRDASATADSASRLARLLRYRHTTPESSTLRRPLDAGRFSREGGVSITRRAVHLARSVQEGERLAGTWAGRHTAA